MTEHTSDDRLLDELRRALEAADPVPEDVLAAAKASFTWRTVEAELAEIAFDSATEELAGVRSEGADRQLTFRAEAVEVEILVYGGERRRIVGQLVPPCSATVELVSGTDILRTDTGDDGTFTFTEVREGPVTIRCSIGDTTIATESLVL